MGVDLYAGTISRYYSGNWDNVAQAYGKSQGIPVLSINPNQSEADDICPPEEVVETAITWRTLLSRALKEHLESPLDWPEGFEPPYFTERIGWDGYAAVQLLAAYATLGITKYPTVLEEEWSEDPLYRRVVEDALDSPYMQIFSTEIWIPAEFPFVFANECLGEEKRLIGSVPTLLKQLEALNQATFRGVEADFGDWDPNEDPENRPFEACAKFGLGIWLAIARSAIANQLSIILDY